MKKDMNIMPYISVLIVCRNEEEYIRYSLQSVLDQDYPDNRYEILIIDGKSDDGTVKTAKQVADEYELVKVLIYIFCITKRKFLQRVGISVLDILEVNMCFVLMLIRKYRLTI